jgi:Na+/H+-dicarboxylate symporter
MKEILKNYKSTIILISAIIVGVIVGLIFGSDASVLKPFGDLFLNLLLMVIVPLIFITITTSICKMESPKRLKKIISRIFIAFVIVSTISALIGVSSTYMFKLVDSNDSKILELLDESSVVDEDLSILGRTVSLLTTDDFVNLLSRDNIMALLVISIIVGFAIRMSGKNGEKVKDLLISLNDIVLNIVKIIMYYAPIGLGCYMASLIGTYGSTIASGFLKTFIIYTIVCLFVYFVVYSIYALIGGGKEGLKKYWLNIIAPTATALGTCSSAACIPVNSEACKKMGVSSDIAETIVPLGTTFHKDGSIIGSAFKIMFLVYLFDMSPSVWLVLGVSLLVTLLIAAVPIGGGTISEMMIITLMGFPVAALPILTVIATIIDAPATVLNVVGDSATGMLVSKMVDGK